MRQWVPISTSPKGRLTLVALRAFGSRRFDDVTVGELSTEAGVTTGALYHHFGNKLGLYEFVRGDVEQRLTDRMEGAADSAADRTEALRAALLVGFDFAVKQQFQHLLAAPPSGTSGDRLVEVLTALTTPGPTSLALVLAAAWRAAIQATTDGGDVDGARKSLLALEVRIADR